MDAIPVIPGYELLQPLGGGPMTAVFAAHDLERDVACALKLVRPDWDDQPAAIKLLQREARVGLAVRHPRVVRFIDAHVTRAPYYLSMELLPGESLRCRLVRERRLDERPALHITRQMAEALVALHRGGFIHGDLKPDNIHLVDDTKAVLIDLGCAHRPGENAAFLRQGYLLGTADYLAPEMCSGEREADDRADIYSLGVTLFEMLTGQLPYPTGSARETLRRHHRETPADIRQWSISLPVTNLVGRLMAPQAVERPRASALVQQLLALETPFLRRAAA